MAEGVERWQGRNGEKDALRREIWSALETIGAGVGPVWSRIPDFVGAEAAAARLAATAEWRAARIVKCNPDPPQIPVRRRALEEGKLLYAPVPELVKPFPFVLLDPEALARRRIPFADAARSEVFVEEGEPVRFQDMRPMDFVVVGSVAVTREGGRTGKGGGFADLELGIFRELGLVRPSTPIATTVHGLQVVDRERLIMQAHDSALHYVATPDALIETRTTHRQPLGVDWDRVQPDQYAGIPFLRELRAEIEGRRA
ncbi:5-formyltetrahydrofolate cyclo-ligase [Prosthecomicrobium sp. N25]|uniref:5-formyltetrahydrofolate cyclo-ligase n=1 Tax=Prosthecomicrobium sp. N25 TaxID=3129254 RepID=UPI00307842C0